MPESYELNGDYRRGMCICAVLGWEGAKKYTPLEIDDFHRMLDMGGEL